MNFESISKGSLCVIDTNVLLYAEQGFSHQCRKLIKRCSEGEVVGVLPQTVWQELNHKLMLAEAMMKGILSGPNAGKKLSKNPHWIKSLGTYRDKILALKDMGFSFEPCSREDYFGRAIQLQKKYGLLTHDSIILAAAVRMQADFLVSADKVYDQITEIKIAKPDDIRMS